MYGTGTVKDFEKEVYDQYVDTNRNNNYDFQIVNEEYWQFLVKRYGGSTIRRFYSRGQSQFFTQVEAKFKPLALNYINCRLIAEGSYTDDMFKRWWSQVSKGASLKDVKKRLVDHLNAAGIKATLDDVRMWLYSEDNKNMQNNIRNKVKEASEALKNKDKSQATMKDEENEEKDEKVETELNSGIEFPGQSLEPLLNSGLRMN